MDVLTAGCVKCLRCGSTDIEVADSYTIIDGSSLFKHEIRHDGDGYVEIAYRPVHSGNKTKFRCKSCGAVFECKIRSDEVETMKEN